jgi:biotin carboxyl carrier protein
MAAVTDGRAPGRPLGPDDDDIADPRAIRVTLAPGSAAADLPPILVAPADVPGTVMIDGLPRVATLTALDAERAVLVRGDDPADPAYRTALTLLPVRASRGLGRGIVRREVIVDGWRIEVDLEPAVRAALRDRARRGREEIGDSGPTEVRAIIPGVVVSVAVAAGDTVSAGQQLLVIEAMKMQNELRAPRDGSIERVAVAGGAKIEVGDLLIVLT